MRKFRHNKTGKEYELIQESLLFKDKMETTQQEPDGDTYYKIDYVWRKWDNLVLYKALYDCPEGPYFVRCGEDFFSNFTEIKESDNMATKKIIEANVKPHEWAKEAASFYYKEGTDEWYNAYNIYLDGWDKCRFIVNDNTEYSI